MDAVIFDMDGVLVDSESMSCGAWLPVLRRHRITATLKEIEAFLGQSDRAVLEHFRKKNPDSILDNRLIDEKELEYFKIARPNLKTFQDLPELLERLKTAQIPMAVASSGRHTKIKFTLETTGLKSYFDVICSATDVANGKPAPDLFLQAASLLSIAPTCCIVIEDSIPGITAARSAGMYSLGFTSSHSASVLLNVGADEVFEQYAELLDADLSFLSSRH